MADELRIHERPTLERPVLVGAEYPAAEDGRSEEAEVARRHPAGPELLGERATRVVDDGRAEGGDVLHHVRLLAPMLELRGRAGAEVALRRRRLEEDEAIGLRVGERPQEDGVHHAEDGRRRPDPYRERQRHDGGVAGPSRWP